MVATTTGAASSFITFSRGSLATVTDADGKIKWAPHNLLLASEQFDASSWTRQGLSGVTANSIAAPNGTTTADKITENGLNDFHYVVQTSVIDDSAPVSTLSVFAKAAERQYLNLAMSWGANYVAATFDVSGGTVTSNRTGGTGASQSSSITSIGSGWYLCTLRGTIGTTGSDAASIALSNTDTPTGVYPQYTGTSGHGIHLWGAHLYRSDLGGMQANASAYPMYNPSTPRNLLGWSEDFSNATWNAVTNATVSTNAGAAPNGSQTADLIYPASSGSNRQRYQAVTGQTSGTRYTVSIYLKSSSMQWVAMLSPNGANFGCYFDLVNGVKGTEASGVTGSITSLGDGWYRCSVSQVSSATTIYCGISFADANGGTSVTASGTSGVLAWGAQLSDSASLDPYVGSYGAAPSAAAAHGPRLDYDPVTLAARGLLVEEQRANLLTYSNEFDNVVWLKGVGYNSTISSNTSVAPDGSSTADSVIADNAGGTGNVILARSTAVTSGTSYTLTFFAKAGTLSWIRLFALGYTSPGNGGAYFNLSGAGAVGTVDSGYTASISAFANGWYRCSLSFAAGSTVTGELRLLLANANNDTAVSRNGTSSVLVWGAQLETGSFATSYIPTAASTVTRNADVASVATSQFPYSASEGTIVAAYSLLANTGSLKRVFDLYDTTKGNYENIIAVNGININNSVIYAEIVNGSSGQASFALGTPAVGANHKSGIAFAANNINAANNGTLGTLDPTGTIPSANTLRIGAHADSTVLNGWIRQITYLPRRISDSELQARTV